MMPKVMLVVLNWNNVPDTLKCLQSLEQLSYPHYTIVVVDNGSSDDSVSRIRAAYPNVEVLETGTNLGYAGGNNVGIRYALGQGADYVLLLNDDAVVHPGALSALVDAALAYPRGGFFGPKVYMIEDRQRLLSAGRVMGNGWDFPHRGIGELDEGQYDQVCEVDALSGCALFVSREPIETVGMLDEDFFVYREDIDWCYRGKQAGFKVLFVPEAKVWHPDTRRRDVDSPLVTYYISRNHLLFLAKQHLGAGIILSSLATYLRRVLKWSVLPRWRHEHRQRDALVRAMVDFVGGRFGRAEWLA